MVKVLVKREAVVDVVAGTLTEELLVADVDTRPVTSTGAGRGLSTYCSGVKKVRLQHNVPKSSGTAAMVIDILTGKNSVPWTYQYVLYHLLLLQ